MNHPDQDGLMNHPNQDGLMNYPNQDGFMNYPDQDGLMNYPNQDGFMNYPDQDSFIQALKKHLSLPMEVTGKVVVAKRNVLGQGGETRTRIFLTEIIDSSSNTSITLPDNSLLSSIFIGPSDPVLLELENQPIKTRIFLNRNKKRQQIAYDDRDFSQLLFCDRKMVYQEYGARIEKRLIETYQLDNLETALQRLEDTVNALEEKDELLYSATKELDSKQEELSSFNKKLQDIEQQIKSLEKQKNILNSSIRELQKFSKNTNKTIQDNIHILKNFGLLAQSKSIEHDNTNTISIDEFTNDGKINYSLLVDYIHAFILNNGIYYDRDTILDFFALVRTHDFIVLAGKSGIGKTSLVKEFAKAVNGKCAIIPVKPNWASKEDLLGYYNPIQRQYISTEFLNILIEAENNPDIPYFVCLDEMNLARVEYYFADFLSKMEERGDSPIQIELYFPDIFPHIPTILEILKDNKPTDILPNTILDNQNIVNFLKKHYQILDNEKLNGNELYELFINLIPKVMPNVRIGHNVHFFGTANIDDSTHYFSPKVLDRVQVMKFGNPFDVDHNELEQKSIEYHNLFGSNILHYQSLIPITINNDILGKRDIYPNINDEAYKDLVGHLKKVSNLGKKTNIYYGWRFVRQVCNYKKHFDILTNNEEEDMFQFNFYSHKIFPLISVSSDDEAKDILSLAKNNRKIVDILENISNTYKDKQRIVSYWDI